MADALGSDSPRAGPNPGRASGVPPVMTEGMLSPVATGGMATPAISSSLVALRVSGLSPTGRGATGPPSPEGLCRRRLVRVSNTPRESAYVRASDNGLPPTPDGLVKPKVCECSCCICPGCC